MPVMTALEDIDLGFEIPKDRIAQRPPKKRGATRLLVYDRRRGRLSHHRFHELPGLLPRPSLLILNNTRVVPCRLIGKKPSGGKIDLLLLRWVKASGAEGLAEVMARGSGSGVKAGTDFIHEKIRGTFLEKTERKSFLLKLWTAEGDGIVDMFSSHALMPLPPYVRRVPDREDLQRYQTVYSRFDGSIAAPTAGLHFNEEIIGDLRSLGHEIIFITLHVGRGTFNPIRSLFLEEHRMHAERFSIVEKAAAAIKVALAEGRTLLPVGTSCVRALEGVFQERGRIEPWEGATSLFIKPGFTFNVTGGMITNFHTPHSTPLSLVMALAGIEEIKHAYKTALEKDYMFFSYGDAMMIL